MLTSWDDVLKQLEVIKFSCGYSTKSSVVVGRVCQLSVEEMRASMRSPLGSPYLNPDDIQTLLDLAKERESWNIDPICNEFVNIVSKLPLSMSSQFYIISQQLRTVVEGNRNPNTTSFSERPQTCSLFIECPLSPNLIASTIQFLGDLNQTVIDLHIHSLTLGETGTDVKSTNIQMDPHAESCNLVNCNFPYGVQKDLGYQLSKCDKLKVLNIPSMPCMALEVAPYISNCIFLSSLNLANCKISEELSWKLCDDLKFTPQLRVVDLSSNDIGPKGARILAESISRWGNGPPLVRMYLKGCNLDSTSCVSVMEALVSCKELYGIDVSDNKIGGSLQALEMHGICPQPVSLRMRNTSLFDQDIRALAIMIERGDMLNLSELSLGYSKLRVVSDDQNDQTDIYSNIFHPIFRNETTDTLLAWNIILANVKQVYLSESSNFGCYDHAISHLVQTELRRRDGESRRAEILLDLLAKYFAGEIKDIKHLYFL